MFNLVIARLDRAIRYFRGVSKRQRGRGVLDTPLGAFTKASATRDHNRGEALAETGRGV